jgi:hypothetical protein
MSRLQLRAPGWRTAAPALASLGIEHIAGRFRAIVRYPETIRCPANHGATNMTKIVLEIRKVVLSLAVLAAMLLPTLYAAPAHAQANNMWVSRSGSDANQCTLISPCAHFFRALNLAQPQLGVPRITCLDSGDFGPMNITISVSIDCTGTVATPNTDGVNTPPCAQEILINGAGIVVSLRGLNLGGWTIPLACPVANGIVIQAATAVNIEDCVIENFSQRGILDQRTGGLTKLAIKNTIVRNNGSAGIVAAAAPKNSVVLENVHSVGNAYGIAVATGNNVVISRSFMTENAVAGIEADPGAQVFVDNTEISHNVSYGVLALGTVGLANSDIAFNTSSISGSTLSYGNNRLFGNGGGTAPTPVGAASTDLGQQ